MSDLEVHSSYKKVKELDNEEILIKKLKEIPELKNTALGYSDVKLTIYLTLFNGIPIFVYSYHKPKYEEEGLSTECILPNGNDTVYFNYVEVWENAPIDQQTVDIILQNVSLIRYLQIHREIEQIIKDL